MRIKHYSIAHKDNSGTKAKTNTILNIASTNGTAYLAMDKIEVAHGILLTEDSNACGYSIRSLNLDKSKVTLVSFRRGEGETESPSVDTVLQSQDTLVVRGKPYRVERFERRIHEGR